MHGHLPRHRFVCTTDPRRSRPNTYSLPLQTAPVLAQALLYPVLEQHNRTSVMRALLVAAVVVALALNAEARLLQQDLTCPNTPLGIPEPKWYHKPVPKPLQWLRYDGISPFVPKGAEVWGGNNLNLYLQGRGDKNPLAGDAFGAGMRLTTKYAYKAGSVCAWMRYPDPRSGTIVGLYLIDVHPKGATRSSTKWREVDYEWLGAHPDEVATSLFKQGQNQPNAIPHKLSEVTGAPGITVKDPVHYCIHWDLRSANNKTLEWTARAPGKPVQTVRRWTPENEELNKYWDVPLRAIFTIWSNRHIVEWSGTYNIDADTLLDVEFKDVSFNSHGSQPFCVEKDEDLEPMGDEQVTGR